MHTFIQDLRYAARTLLNNRGFAAVVILTMALGIGANTAIFSVVNAVLLRPLTFPHPERLMSLTEEDDRMPHGSDAGVSYPNFFDWRKQAHSFESMASYHDADLTLTGVGQPQHLSCEVVSSDFFRVFGVAPMLGRGFIPEEEQSGNRAAVLSHTLWQSRFGSNPGIIGQQITLDGKGYTVVGVMPAGFAFPEHVEVPALWTSISEDAFKSDPKIPASTEQRGMQFLEAVGRLKPGVSAAQAQAELDSVASTLAKQYPQTNGHSSRVSMMTLRESMVGDTRPLLGMLFGAVAFVLMIACANTANLLMARAGNRQNEIAVRAALGASQSRLIRQLLTEAILLAFVGAALGLVLARVALEFFRRQSGSLPRIAEVSLDARVLLFTVFVALLTGVLFGLVPAVQVARPNVLGVLRSGMRNGGGKNQSRLRDLLVVGETALGLLLLVGSGLLIGSLLHMLRDFPGFDSRNVLTVRVDVPSGRYEDAAALRFYKNVLPRLSALPGVKSASGVFPLPLSESDIMISMQTEEHQFPKGQRPAVPFASTSPTYFQTMGIALVQGRNFTDGDDENAPPVMIVNESFVHKYFPNEKPIGKRVEIGMGSSLYRKGETPWREIVGVVGDVKQRKLNIAPPPAVYVPYPQAFLGTLTLTIKTMGDATAVAGAVRHEIASVDRDLPVYNIRTMDDYISQSVAVPKFHTFLLTLFAALALILAAVGLYGVMSYMVVQRTRDIGVRIALGAAPGDITRMVLGKGVVLSLIGAGIGTFTAVLLTRFMKAFLYGVQPLDVMTFGAVIALLVGVAALSSYLPARRAAAVDPMVALRAE